MLNELKTNLEAIYQEKQEKVIPENIKKGITIFGVEGELASMPYIEEELINNVVFSNPTGATYTFTKNSSGYYESNNKGVHSSVAMGRFTFNVIEPCDVVLQYINYAESSYDYGIIGKADQTLANNTSVDSGATSLSGKQYADAKKLSLGTLSAGTHYVDFKFRKDGSANVGNDSLQIKLLTAAKQYINYPIYMSEEDLLADTTQPDETYAIVVDDNMMVVSTWFYSANTWTQTQIMNRNAKWYKNNNEFSNDTLNRASATNDNPYYGIIGERDKVVQYIGNNMSTSTMNKYIKKSVTLNSAITTDTYHFAGQGEGMYGSNYYVIVDIYLDNDEFTFIRQQDYSTSMYDEVSQTDRYGYNTYKLNFTSADGINYTFNNAVSYFHFYATTINNVSYPARDTNPIADTIEEVEIDGVTYIYIPNCYLGYSWGDNSSPYEEIFSNFVFATSNTFEKILYSTAPNSYSTYNDNLYATSDKMAECKVYANGNIYNGTMLDPLSYSNSEWDGGYIGSPETKLEMLYRLNKLLTTSDLLKNVPSDFTNGYFSVTGWQYDTIPEFYIDERVQSLSLGGNNLIEVPNLDYSHLQQLNIESPLITNLNNIDISNVERLSINNIGSLDLDGVDLGELKYLSISANNNGVITHLDTADLSKLETLDIGSNLTFTLDGLNLPLLEDLYFNSSILPSTFTNVNFPALKRLQIQNYNTVQTISSWGDLDLTNIEEIRVSKTNIPAITFTDKIKVFEIYGSTQNVQLTGDLSGLTQLGINNDSVTTSIGNLNTPNLTNIGGSDWNDGPWASTGFHYLTELVSVGSIDTSKVTNWSYAFYNDSKLETIPIFNLSSMTSYFYGVFRNCPNLTNESLNNILASILTLPANYSGGKSLSSQFGLSSTQITTAKTLSNWSSVSALGWS